MRKAMLLAERAESKRLRQIIKELQRHRFGRRAETLPEEQLQLGLEEAEQVEAAGQAETEEEASAERKTRRPNRGALAAHLPRVETVVDVASMMALAWHSGRELAQLGHRLPNRRCSILTFQ